MSSHDCSFEFLGTMAGNPVYLKKYDTKLTYGRTYTAVGGSDDLRQKISKIGDDQFGQGYKKLGEQYSYTPSNLWDGRPFNTTTPSSMQGGGFFLTVKNFTAQDERHLNCFAYALGTFGKELEKLVGNEMKTIQESVLLSIDHIVDQYFTNIDEPKDGDLAVYGVSPGTTMYTPQGGPVSGTTHAGIYRKSNPNWNSPKGGTIESKWGWFANPYIFEHDIFFTPDFYGDTVKFYRLK